MATFHEMELSKEVVRATVEMGFEEMTPIQEQAIPIIMSGRDIIGQAQTGTGKTAAFGIPMIEKITKGSNYIQGLVVTPTRELAVQVAEELNTIGKYAGIRSLPIYGGQDIGRQIRSLKLKPQIIVATPGRLMDHMRRKTIRLQQVEVTVLDEADEMLNMGFVDDIEAILKEVPEERLTLLFSATMPKPILDLSRRFMKSPEFISIKSKGMTVPNTEQYYVRVQEKQKFDVLCRILDTQSPDLAIVFGRTKRRVDELSDALIKRGYSAEGIHGDLTQSKRDSVMRNFKRGVTEILVATDVAARGLDIGGVTHVYNFDIPQDPENYVHRIGRTGRVGKAGVALTFITSREHNHLNLIERVIKKRITQKPAPSLSEALEGQQRLVMDKLIQTVKEEDIHHYKEIAEEMLGKVDAVSLLSAALKLMTKEPDTTPVALTEERGYQSSRPKQQDKGVYRGAPRRKRESGRSGRPSYGQKGYRK